MCASAEGGRYDTSDLHAIAFASLAGVMAIILFLVEKTPLTVVRLLVVMVVPSIYPILHFAESKPVNALGAIQFQPPLL